MKPQRVWLPRDWVDALHSNSEHAMRAMAADPAAVAVAGDVIRRGKTPLFMAVKHEISVQRVTLFLDLTGIVPDTTALLRAGMSGRWNMAMLFHDRGARYQSYAFTVHAAIVKEQRGTEAALQVLACYRPSVWHEMVRLDSPPRDMGVILCKKAVQRRERARQAAIAVLSLRRKCPWGHQMQHDTLRMIAQHLMEPRAAIGECWASGMSLEVPDEPATIGAGYIRRFGVEVLWCLGLSLLSGLVISVTECISNYACDAVPAGMDRVLCIGERFYLFVLRSLLWIVKLIERLLNMAMPGQYPHIGQ